MTIQFDFSGGEISDIAQGRADLQTYGSSAALIENLLIDLAGSLSMRPGFVREDTIAGDPIIRMVGWSRRGEDIIICFRALEILVFVNGTLISILGTPWSALDVPDITYATDDKFVIFCHPDHPQKILEKLSAALFALNDYLANVDFLPFARIAATSVTLTPSATTGSITITASASVFVADHIGAQFRIQGRRLTITGVTSGTIASADVDDALAGVAATAIWDEQAFSDAVGYPAAVTWHQGRLWFGNVGSVPNGLWFSRSGQPFNFNDDAAGTVTDASGGHIVLNQDEITPIRHLASKEALLIFHEHGVTADFTDLITATNFNPERQDADGIGDIRPILTPDGVFYVKNGGREAPLLGMFTNEFQSRYQSQIASRLNQDLVDGVSDIAYGRSSDLDGAGRFCRLRPGRDITIAQITPNGAGMVRMPVQSGDEIIAIAEANDAVYAAYSIDGGDQFLVRLDASSLFDGSSQNAKSSGSSTAAVSTAYDGVPIHFRDVSTGQIAGPLTPSAGSVTDASLIGISLYEYGRRYGTRFRPLLQTPSQRGGRERSIGLGRVDLLNSAGVQRSMIGSLDQRRFTEAVTPSGNPAEQITGWREFHLADNGDDREPVWELHSDGGQPMTIRQINTMPG